MYAAKPSAPYKKFIFQKMARDVYAIKKMRGTFVATISGDIRRNPRRCIRPSMR